MIRKLLVIMGLLLLMIYSLTFAEFEYYKLDEGNNGVVIVTYPLEAETRYIVKLSKDGKRYYYDLSSSEERYPLQMGAGTYRLAILKNIGGSAYTYEYRTSFFVDGINEEEVFLNSIQVISWDETDDAIKYVDEIVEDTMTDMKKVEVIHEYVSENFRYDYDKLNAIKGAYIPDIDRTFQEKSGICYDFTSLFASMLRSEGIQTKLVMGYRTDTSAYHSWNEVYVNEQWFVVDITLDIEESAKDLEYEMFKDSLFYEKRCEY